MHYLTVLTRLPNHGTTVTFRPWDIADQDVAELERKALHFKKLVESDNPENREEIDDMVAEFQQQSAAYLPQSMQADEGPATRRRYWSMEEDRFVLSSFVKWASRRICLDSPSRLPCWVTIADWVGVSRHKLLRP